MTDTRAVVEYCNKNKVTVATLPPNYFIQTEGLNLRILITAGSESSKQIIEKANSEIYINAYGPTETTVCATYWKYDKNKELGKSISIGKPIRNSKAYILNGEKLCGIGVPGELCVSGIGLARGYLNMLEITERKFTNNPYGEGKLYRTGDLARWLPDGNIEYLGRIDEQVKIRGFRVELGEIENVIRDIEYVEDVVVTAKEDKSGEKAICAYIVSGGKIKNSVLKEKVGDILPQ